MLKKLLSFVLLAAATIAHADDGDKAARDAIHSLLPMAIIDQVVKSDLPGFYEVIISGQVAYVSADGKYLLQGNLYDVAAKRDLTAARVATMRAQALEKLPATKKIVFAPEHPKHTVTVFTDVDCPYCRQFHKQIAEYNRVGIAVNYIMYPLDIHPGADKKAVAVWCAKDRNVAYTEAMSGRDPGAGTCTNPVAETKALGISLGINATPTILAEDGAMVNAAKTSSAETLLAELDRLAAAHNKANIAAR
jgi:thiol:disulfide interchange protein DsbC